MHWKQGCLIESPALCPFQPWRHNWSIIWVVTFVISIPIFSHYGSWIMNNPKVRLVYRPISYIFYYWYDTSWSQYSYSTFSHHWFFFYLWPWPHTLNSSGKYTAVKNASPIKKNDRPKKTLFFFLPILSYHFCSLDLNFLDLSCPYS